MTAKNQSDLTLEVNDLKIEVDSRTLLNHLNLSVEPGEFIAVLGRNGAGKTSLFRAILGLEAVAVGEIRVLGELVRRGDRRIGYIPQQRMLPPETPLTARDLVMLGRNGTRFGFPINKRGDRDAVDAAIARVGGSELARRPIGSLSGGEQQRFRIAQAIVDSPPLLLLDEPLSSLDPNSRAEMVELARAQCESGTAVLFITHDLEPVMGVADRAIVLRGDGTYWLGRPAEVPHSDLHDHPHHGERG